MIASRGCDDARAKTAGSSTGCSCGAIGAASSSASSISESNSHSEPANLPLLRREISLPIARRKIRTRIKITNGHAVALRSCAIDDVTSVSRDLSCEQLLQSRSEITTTTGLGVPESEESCVFGPLGED